MHAIAHDTSPLPDGWSPIEAVEDTVLIGGLHLHRAGVASVGPDGEEVTGAGAEATSAPMQRSYFELLERVATLDALREKRATYDLLTEQGDAVSIGPSRDVFPDSSDPATWRYARSNGVAIHGDWRAACERALWELAERDRVLRSWYGDVEPERLPELHGPLGAATTHEWCTYRFPEPTLSSFSAGIEVIGVFGFPTSTDGPLVMGLGARPDARAAHAAAANEAMQLLAFLWGEPVPSMPPDIGPTAGHHLDHYQWHGSHDRLRRWLAGEHLAYRGLREAPCVSQASKVRFVDLTPRWLRGGLRVAKAVCASATPLIFGASPMGLHLPPELRAHPIC